jgi:predicted nucleic-acid-binding protein
MIALDTNVVLRILVRDDLAQTDAAISFLERHAGLRFFLADLVVLETVWTLARLYRYPRGDIVRAIRSLMLKQDVDFENRMRIQDALAHYADGGDFADRLLLSIAREHGCTALASFDADLGRREPDFVCRP